MREETDYSEEAKYDLFESVSKERIDWVKCIIARTVPSYEDVKREMEKKDMSVSRKEYEKICRELGFS
ncbi:hypothetical protein EBZ39_03315 [bacterium]|nr:hypothetical protein [bacterium]